jgi:hypothetical protein
MNIYGFGVVISIVFEIFSQFPISGGGVAPGAISNVLQTRNMNIYGLRVVISIVFEIFSQFPISGGWVGLPHPTGPRGSGNLKFTI